MTDSNYPEFVKTAKHTAQSYDLIAQRYAEVWFENPSKPLADQFLSYLPRKSRILDAGCGPGQYTKYFWDQDRDAIGIDISIITLKGAVDRCDRFLFVCNDLSNLAFVDKAFDGAWVCASLMHVPEDRVRIVLREIHRVLRDEGVIFANVQKGNSNRIEAPDEFNQHGKYGRFFQRYPSNVTLEEHMLATGYKVISFWETIVESSVLENARDKIPHWLNYIAKKRG